MIYGRFLRGKTTVDLGLAVYMPGPASFTGEDTAELNRRIAEKNYEKQDNYTAVVLTVG